MPDSIEGLGRWRTQGLYDFSVASRLTGVSANSIKRWMKGYPSSVAELKPTWEDFFGNLRTEHNRLSFLEFVEVLLAGKIRAGKGGSYQQVREYHDGLAAEWGTEFPFAHENLLSQKGLLSQSAAEALGQMDFEDGFASRWLPFGKDGSLALDPRRAGGQPAIKGRRLRVVDISGQFKAGHTIKWIADDFDLRPIDVEQALRYALMFKA